METMNEMWAEWLRREEASEAMDIEAANFDDFMKCAEEFGGES